MQSPLALSESHPAGQATSTLAEPLSGGSCRPLGPDAAALSRAGVADQLQTNFASDLRSILKTVFHIVTSQPEAPVGTDTGRE